MLFFADVSIFARPPFKTCRSHLNDTIFFQFSCFLVTIRDFEGSKRVFSVPGSKNRAKILKINLGNPPKVLRKAPYQLAVFWPNFLTRNARNSIKGSKNVYYALESTNTASQNIGAWDWMMSSYNNEKTCPCHDPIGPKPPAKLKKKFFNSKPHDATSHYGV